MDRIKRNPGGWGLVLGGAVGLVSIFFVWLVVTNTAADVSSRLRGVGTITGQTIGFSGLLAMIAGLGVIASTGSGRIWWGLLGLLGAGIVLLAGLVAIFSPETLAQNFATNELVATMKLNGAYTSASEAIKSGFDSGALSARLGIGAIIGLVGGLLGILGAIYGFRKKRPEAD